MPERLSEVHPDRLSTDISDMLQLNSEDDK